MSTFKTRAAMRLALAGSAALLTHTTLAQTWQTVDDFQYITGSAYNQARASAVDAQGNVYIAGEGYDSAGVMHAVVMGSSDHGSTWVPLEDFTSSTNRQNQFNALGFDSAQNLYAAGLTGAMGRPANPHLVIRKSPDYGATWSTVLELGLSGYYAQAGTPGFAADNAGAVYVATWNGPSGSIILKSADAGATWSILHPFTDTALVDGIVNTPAGLFVCGSSSGIFGAVAPYNLWGIVRKSVDGGLTWASVDTYNPPGVSTTYQNQVSTICADTQGNVYVGGWATITAGSGRRAVSSYNWIIRKGTNLGSTWQTVATFVPPYAVPPGSLAPQDLNALRADAAGNLYAAGIMSHWIVMKGANQGANWSLSDDATSYANAWGLGLDLAGNIYAVGFAGPSTILGLGGHWIVRKGAAQ